MSIYEDRTSELLFARFCHELATPIGTTKNALEVMNEGPQETFERAYKLAGISSRKAAARLRYYRVAYGSIRDGLCNNYGECLRLIEDILEGSTTTLAWKVDTLLKKPDSETLKLILNLTLVAADTLPFGGEIVVEVLQGKPITITAIGEKAGINPIAQQVFDETDTDVDDLSIQTIQVHYAKYLAEKFNYRIVTTQSDGKFEMRVLS